MEPQAYPGIPLARHNAMVAGAVSLLFEKRLNCSTTLYREVETRTGISGAVFKAAVLAGALHDIGKASPTYQERLDTDKPSFYLHEHVSALLILGATSLLAPREGEEKEKNLGRRLFLLLVAEAVARHHAAMRMRHPRSLYNARGPARRLRDVLIALSGNPEILRRALPRSLAESWIEEALIEAAEKVVKPHIVAAYLGPSKLHALSHGSMNERWTAAVHVVSGALIASDILVASIVEERGNRLGDPLDALTPIYAKSWAAELGPLMVELRRLDQEKADALIEEALNNTWVMGDA